MYLLITISLCLVLFTSLLRKKYYIVSYVSFFLILNAVLFSKASIYSLRLPVIYAIMILSVLLVTGLSKFIINICRRLLDPMVLVLVLIFLMMLVQLPFNNLDEGKRIIRIFMIATFPICIYLLGIISHKRQLRDIYNGIIFFSTAFIILAFLTIDYGQLLIMRSETFGKEIEALNVITLGRTAGLISLISIYSYMNEDDLYKKVILLLNILGGLTFLMLSGTRGALLSLIIALFYYIYIENKYRVLFRIRYIPIYAIAAYLITTLASNLIVFERVTILFSNGISGGSSGRDVIYENAVKMILENPLGNKVGAFNAIYDTYPHNIFLEFGVLFGWLGLGMIFLFIGIGFWYVRKVTRMNYKYTNLIALIWIYSIINTMFSGDININNMFWFSSILLVASKRIIHRNTRR